MPVHPHGCGENKGASGLRYRSNGSPPRVWGKFSPELKQEVKMRFTPTGVGKIFATLSDTSVLPVHPHGCGENKFWKHPNAPRHGSPPRVWGKFLAGCAGSLLARFTPTGVGKMSCLSAACSFSAVHPHGCGENAGWRLHAWARPGSPPRVWGKLSQMLPHHRRSRFTPTGVGKIAHLSRRRFAWTVHPHGCGENGFANFQYHCLGGSPPRVWGK